MNREYALTLWRADLVRFGLDDRALKTGKTIIANHAGWHRRYHGLNHLGFLFQALETDAEQISDLPRLTYAAWFHDAVYKTWRKDNERASADWAQSALIEMGADRALTERVHALILATANHSSGGQDADDALFLDMDCAILGSDPAVYAEYVRQIRFEYGWVPGSRYKSGRRAFVKSQLDRPTIFHSNLYQDRYEAQARRNLQNELASLT